MFNILIVDDEIKHRKCLAAMIRELRSEYDVCEAKNGSEALEIAKSKQMDIIITDIRMPIMDGLTFIEALHGFARNTKIVILSGFAYFDYAQKAMSLGAFDYLLKPVNEAKIVKMLERIEKAIEEEKREQQEKICLKKQLNTALPAYVEHLMNEWIQGVSNCDAIEEIKKIFPYEGGGFVIATELVNFGSILKGYSIEEANEIRMSIKQWMKDSLNPVGHTISFFLKNNNGTMITIFTNDYNQDIEAEDKMMRLNGFILNLKSLNWTEGFEIHIGVGTAYENILESVQLSFQEALQALGYKFYNIKEEIFLFSNIKSNEGIGKIKRLIPMDKLRNAIDRNDVNRVNEVLQIPFDNISLKEHISPQKFKELIFDAVYELLKQLQGVIDEDCYSILSSRIRELLKAESITSLKQMSESVLMEMLEAVKINKPNRVIHICEKYIQEHYQEDIPLETMAEMFRYNTSYFSSYFKSNTGMNFSEYLQKVRLQKATEMLRSKDFKIYEIAEKNGYNNAKYFIRVFKKEFGISPDEYRRVNSMTREALWQKCSAN